jgi:hypothetical protein
VQVLKQQTVVDDGNNDLAPVEIISDSGLLWPAVIGMYGVLRPGVSQLRLDQPDGSEVIGTIVLDPNDERLLLFSVDEDTVPQNTLTAIDAVINPLSSGPGQGLPAAVTGQRYLLTEDTGAEDNVGPATAWVGANGRPLVAQANDIIEYDGARWDAVFVASQQPDQVQYVTNLTTGIQYEWTGQMWIKSYQGVYPGGEWSLVL